ncbi:metallophosphoesterase [Enterococcus sp. LJL99]
MKIDRTDKSFPIEKQSIKTPSITGKTLATDLTQRFDLYPENKRRPINKTLFKNDYFQLTYNTRDQTMAISSRGDLVYSAIPYDTARNYIQRAAIQYLLHPEAVHQYLEAHKPNIETYLKLSIFQMTNQRVDEHSFEVIQAYQEIRQNPLFEIQILGRLLQHDETGPLSANLPGKFLFSENAKTGISAYLSEYLNFVVQLTKTLPIMTDGRTTQFLENDEQKTRLVETEMSSRLTIASDIQPALALLPQEVKQKIEESMTYTEALVVASTKPILRSEVGKELSEVRKNYTAHSVNPKELEKYFEDVHATDNTNHVNVVSDVQTNNGKLPFTNPYFNIFAGNISDSHATDEQIQGLYVLGNHDLVDVIPDNRNKEGEQWDIWRPFFKTEWFQTLLCYPDDAWYLLPVGDAHYYECVKTVLEKRFVKMKILNNESLIYEGIRYIGLTVPVVLTQRKKEQQRFIFKTLKKLLTNDFDIPTVIVSHAPIFNELSLLSPKSKAYNKEYTCSEPKIEKLFETYNIIGAIHGHHRIPASSGRYKIVEFAGKKLFVVCSIYSKMNTGIELMELINEVK